MVFTQNMGSERTAREKETDDSTLARNWPSRTWPSIVRKQVSVRPRRVFSREATLLPHRAVSRAGATP